MFYSPRLYFRDFWVSSPLIASLLAQIFVWWNLVSNIGARSGQIFLHYNIIFGVDLVGDWRGIYYFPVAGIIVIIANFFFSNVCYRSDKFLSRVLACGALLFNIFLAVGIYLLVEMNT